MNNFEKRFNQYKQNAANNMKLLASLQLVVRFFDEMGWDSDSLKTAENVLKYSLNTPEIEAV